MKNILYSLLLLISTSVAAQEVGIRFGNTSAVGENNNVAIDGIFAVGEISRVHADVSFGDGVGLDALWDFVHKPLGEESFYWYAGAGPSLFIGNKFSFGISGEIGLEYNFNGAPIAIGIDYRPTFWLVENTSFEWGGFGFNVRYRFNN